MTESETTLLKVLRAIDEVEKENAPACTERIAARCGLSVVEVRTYLAKAETDGLVYSFNRVEKTSLPTARGWSLTRGGIKLIAKSEAYRDDGPGLGAPTMGSPLPCDTKQL